jgi:hypothetical protein
MADPAVIRPGPLSIEPGRCPGGVVLQVYAVPTGQLVVEQALRPGDDVGDAAELAAALVLPGWAACLVAYDGDTGDRFTALQWYRYLLGQMT